MNEDRCELTELLKSQCAHCQNHKLPDEELEIVTFEGLFKEEDK